MSIKSYWNKVVKPTYEECIKGKPLNIDKVLMVFAYVIFLSALYVVFLFMPLFGMYQSIKAHFTATENKFWVAFVL